MKSLLVLVLALVARAAHADADVAYVPPELFASAPGLPAGYDAEAALRLDLAGALRIAMVHNIGVAVERKQVAATRLGVEQAAGAMYEPTITAGVNHASQTMPPPTRQAGAPGDIITQTSENASLGVAQRLPTGATISLGVTAGRSRSTSGTAPLPLTYGSGLTLALTQPLLRGFSTDLVIPQYALLTAKIASERERHALAITAAAVVQQTEGAYWDVVSALYGYRVAVETQRAAADTMALTRKQIAAGMVPPSELSAAESTAAARELAVLQATAQVEQAWDALRLVMNLPRDQWSRPILPTDVPRFDASPTPSVDDALATALARRPELAQQRLDVKSSQLAIRKAENDKLPQIDLSLGASVLGQGATASAAIGELGARDATGWTIGVNVTWTPMRRASKAAAELARIQHDVKLATNDQYVQQIWNEVRGAVRARNAAALQVAAAARSRALARDALAIENRKYLAGTSSTMVIATAQQNLASAELAELQALINNARAATALLLATGRLLDERHVELVSRAIER